MSFSKYFLKLQNLRCVCWGQILSVIIWVDLTTNIIFFSQDFPVIVLELISKVCWCADHRDQSLVEPFIYLWITMRSCYGGHDSSWKELDSLLFPLQQWDNPGKLFSFMNGFIIFWGAITHSCKLHPLWLICGLGSLSWWDSRGQLLGVKSWRAVDNMWFSCPRSGSGWAAVLQLRCLQQCQMRNVTNQPHGKRLPLLTLS